MDTQATTGRRRASDAPEQPAPAAAEPQGDRAPATAPRVTGRAAARLVAERADGCAATESRGTLHALARALRRGTATPRRAAALRDAIAACLEACGPAGADRWQVAEAAAWGLARLVRGRHRHAEPDGRHLEALVAEARTACAALAERDTRAARFVLVLARLFGDVEACRGLETPARGAVAEEIARLVTPGGSVALSGSAAVVERVARWTDVRIAAERLGGPAWDDAVEGLWAAAAAGSLRLLGTAGRRPVAGAAAPAPERVVQVLERHGRGRARRTARRISRRGAGRRAGLMPCDVHDPAAAVAVIRTGWDRDAVRVLLEYRDAAPRLELALGDRLLLDGPWDGVVERAGRPLDVEGGWTVSCWESGRKAAFVEIAAPLAGGLRLERQIAVLRRERVVLLADAVLSRSEPAADDDLLRYRGTVPLAAGLEAEAAAETREVFVYDAAMRLQALPLALPEWRGVGRGSFTADAGRLVLEQVGHRRLYAPVWLDCEARNIGRPLTWRQLTVADTRRNLPPHQAAGFRVQADRSQWLLYQTLDASRNRTLLGCNVSSGFLLGRVKRSGEVARTLEIE